MPTKPSIKFKMDWSLPKPDFLNQIREQISRCQGLKLAFPIAFSKENIIEILEYIDCSDCQALCCKSNPSHKIYSPYIYLDELDITTLNSLGLGGFINRGKYLVYPCSFLSDNRCTIYENRPVVCRVYPIDPNHTSSPFPNLNLQCPEARRLIMESWDSFWDYLSKNRSQNAK